MVSEDQAGSCATDGLQHDDRCVLRRLIESTETSSHTHTHTHTHTHIHTHAPTRSLPHHVSLHYSSRIPATSTWVCSIPVRRPNNAPSLPRYDISQESTTDRRRHRKQLTYALVNYSIGGVQYQHDFGHKEVAAAKPNHFRNWRWSTGSGICCGSICHIEDYRGTRAYG